MNNCYQKLLIYQVRISGNQVVKLGYFVILLEFQDFRVSDYQLGY